MSLSEKSLAETSLAETSLAETIDGFSLAEGTLSGEVPPTWNQGRTVYGGMTAALSLLGARQLAQGRPLRSAFIGFVGPSSGQLSIEAQELRAGKNTSSVRSRLSSAMGPGVEAVFTFAANRDSVLDDPGPAAPVPRPTADAAGPPAADAAPAFTRNLEFIWACDTIPFTGGGVPLVRAWVRHRDSASRDHPLSLVCLADALPPAVAGVMGGIAPMSSMTWTLDFLDDEPATDDGWWLLESRADFIRGGHSTQDMTIWNTDGNCVAKGRQMITVFA